MKRFRVSYYDSNGRWYRTEVEFKSIERLYQFYEYANCKIQDVQRLKKK